MIIIFCVLCVCLVSLSVSVSPSPLCLSCMNIDDFYLDGCYGRKYRFAIKENVPAVKGNNKG